MESVGIAELKARLSAYLARVRAGEEILVTDRGRAVARLAPVTRADVDEDKRLFELQRQGLVRIGEVPLPREFWELRRPGDPAATVRTALELDREDRI